MLHVTYTTLLSSSKYHDKRRYAIFFIFHLFCQLLNPLDIFSILLHSRCPSHLCSIFLFLIFDWNSSLWLTLFLFNRELDDYNDVAATQHVFLHYLVVIRKKKNRLHLLSCISFWRTYVLLRIQFSLLTPTGTTFPVNESLHIASRVFIFFRPGEGGRVYGEHTFHAFSR